MENCTRTNRKNIRRKDVIKAFVKILLENPGDAIWTQEEMYFQMALIRARGCYQRAILHGTQRLSGSDLQGKAKRWSYRYAISRGNLLKRLEIAKIPFRVIGGTAKTGPKRLDVGVS